MYLSEMGFVTEALTKEERLCIKLTSEGVT
jgi:hypothetical protein